MLTTFTFSFVFTPQSSPSQLLPLSLHWICSSQGQPMTSVVLTPKDASLCPSAPGTVTILLHTPCYLTSQVSAPSCLPTCHSRAYPLKSSLQTPIPLLKSKNWYSWRVCPGTSYLPPNTISLGDLIYGFKYCLEINKSHITNIISPYVFWALNAYIQLATYLFHWPISNLTNLNLNSAFLPAPTSLPSLSKWHHCSMVAAVRNLGSQSWFLLFPHPTPHTNAWKSCDSTSRLVSRHHDSLHPGHRCLLPGLIQLLPNWSPRCHAHSAQHNRSDL